MIEGTQDKHRYKLKLVLHMDEPKWELYEHLGSSTFYTYRLIGRYDTRFIAEQRIKQLDRDKETIDSTKEYYYL
jgi:hypothetical protein